MSDETKRHDPKREGEFEIIEHKAPQKMYTEFTMGGISGASILREDLDKAYTLMPSMGIPVDKSLSAGRRQNSEEPGNTAHSRSATGSCTEGTCQRIGTLKTNTATAAPIHV